MAEFIDILSPSALKDLQTANTEVLTLIKNIDNAGKAMQNVKTPSGSDSAVKRLQTNYQTLETGIVKVDGLLKKEVQTILNQSKSYQELAKQKERYLKINQKEEADLVKANNLYNQTQQKVNQLTQTYNALAIKKELGQQLTAKELTTLSKLTNQINVYQTALKKVDADIQKNNRNVGNYASGWNGLGNSINQLSREMPAFTNSVQTGFMALSNNLPILFDEISRIKQANKELIAQGQPIKSLFSQMAGAIFSVGTLLSVGVTLLTVYGAKIWDSISGSKAKKEALEKEKQALEEKIQAEKDQNTAIGQSIASEQNRARILFEIAKNEEVNSKKRNEALKELRSRYGVYLKDLSDEQILAGQTAEAEERLNQALIGRGYALAVQSLLEQNLIKQMEAQVEYEKATRKAIKGVIEQTDAQTGAIKKGDEYIASLRKNAKANQEATTTLDAKLKPLKEEEEVLLSLFNVNAKYLDAVNETTTGKKNEIKASKELEQVNSSSLNALQKTISALKESYENAEIGSVQYGLLANQIKLLQTIYDGLTKSAENANEAISNGEGIELNLGGSEFITDEDGDRLREEGDKLREILRDYRQSFIDTFADQSGFSQMLDLLSGGLDKFEGDAVSTALAVTDAFQQAFNTITEMSNANFENELRNLQQQKEVSLLFAGESASAREEIERQYDVKQREIKRRQAQAEKRQALFNIAIDTAQAIVASVKASPKTFGLPFSAVALAIGLAQSAVVSNQQIPQYFRGTDNHKGGLMQINDGGGSNFKEIVQTPDGKMRMYDERDKVLNAPKGTKVFTAQKSMDMLSFDNNLNNILLNSGIGNAPKIEVNNQGMSDAQVDRIVSTIQNKTEFIQNIDGNGFRSYVRNGNTIKEIKNNRIDGKGQIF